MEAILMGIAFAGGLLIGVLGHREVPAERVHKAIEVCTTNGGLQSIETDFKTTTALCINGASFEIKK